MTTTTAPVTTLDEKFELLKRLTIDMAIEADNPQDKQIANVLVVSVALLHHAFTDMNRIARALERLADK